MNIFNFLHLVGGLAMFLYGMSHMGASLEKLGGGKFETVLEKMTNSRIKGLLLGAGVTAVIQSSSAVTVMAVGFVNSKIMSLSQVVGIIMGANIGTTITGWILSLTGIESSSVIINLLKPASFTPVLAAVGVALNMFCKADKKKNIGSILVGFAVLMFGMEQMSAAVAPLRDVPEFTSILTKFSNPLLGILAGAVLTAIIQSSSASVGILQALTVTGSITFSAAFPIILGQNIGTCITASLSSIGGSKNAKRTAFIHLLFNVIGASTAVILFYGANAVLKFDFIKNTVDSANIALIHTVFNVFATVLLFPFGNQLEKLACLIIRKEDKEDTSSLIEERFLMSPAYAIDKVKEQCNDMALLAKNNTMLCIDFIKNYSHNKDEKISKNEKMLDAFEDELETYLVKINSMDLTTNDSVKLAKLTHAIGNFERIGDYGVNILKTKRKMHKDRIHFSASANKELEIMSSAVTEIINKAVDAFINDDVDLASTIEPLEQVINNLKVQLRASHSKRIENDECGVENGIMFFDIVNSFERIADHCSNLAVCIIELSQGSYHTHSYLKGAKNKSNQNFMQIFEMYLDKYKIG